MTTIAGTKNPFIKGHNNNRHLSPEELENNIGGLPITESRLRELFNTFDQDGSGYLDKEEVRKLYKQFDNFGVMFTDREIDQQIKKYAIKEYVPGSTSSGGVRIFFSSVLLLLRTLFFTLPRHSDGKVDFQEFCCIILSIAQR